MLTRIDCKTEEIQVRWSTSHSRRYSHQRDRALRKSHSSLLPFTTHRFDKIDARWNEESLLQQEDRVWISKPPLLRNLFVQSRFDLQKQTVPNKVIGLFPCSSCIFCTGGYISACTSFKFGKFNEFTWNYNRKFTCDSANVIYILICGKCWEFYIGQTQKTKTRAYKHKSDGRHPHNSNCRVLAHHLHNHSEFFKLYPIWYEDDKRKREFIEKQFIARYDPPLNRDRWISICSGWIMFLW